MRYFSDEAVLGSAAFVNGVFERQKARLGLKRKTGARKMRDANWGSLHVMRDLQGNRIG